MESSRQVHAGALVLVAIWVAVFTIALGLRTANATVALRDGLPVLSPNDDLYHAKRILHTVEHYPSMLRFDPDRGVTGAYCPWPPLWDFSVATLLRAVGLHGIDALTLAAWFAPLLGACFAATLAAWLAHRLGSLAGLVAGLGVAVPIPLIFIGQLARLDHHVVEGPLMLAIVAATAAIVRDREDRVRHGHAALLALALCAAIFVQTALILGAALAFGIILLLGACRARFVEGAFAFAASAVVVQAYRMTLPDDYPFSPWFLGAPHALMLAAAAFSLGLAALPRLSRLSAFARALAAVIPSAAAMLAVPAIRKGMIEGGGFLGGDRWLSTIAEFRPYFDDPPTRWLDALVLAPLVAAVPLAVSARRRGETGRLAIGLFAIAYGVLAISSRRLVYIAVPLAALAGAFAFDLFLRPGRRGAAAGIAALVVMAPAIATAVYLPLAKEPPGVQTEATIRAALALRRLPASGRILAPWDRGHVISFYGGRAAVVDNFGSVERRSELTAAAAALLSTDDAALLRYCRERGVAYIVLNHPIEQLAATATIAGFDGDRYARGRGWIEPGPDAESTFWWRAYFGGERAEVAGVPPPPPVRGFRLVWSDEMDVGYAFGLRGDAAQVWAVE
ncbi:MAG: hypothetical protein NDJ92_06500 [Thermoanaerobaculia bacterium]|nr:hypothetical protein [Thermoanaerobaculia bacterium]